MKFSCLDHVLRRRGSRNATKAEDWKVGWNEQVRILLVLRFKHSFYNQSQRHCSKAKSLYYSFRIIMYICILFLNATENCWKKFQLVPNLYRKTFLSILPKLKQIDIIWKVIGLATFLNFLKQAHIQIQGPQMHKLTQMGVNLTRKLKNLLLGQRWSWGDLADG